MIAQWAIESAWCAKPAGHANYSGIKKADRQTKCCTVTTNEIINGKSVVENLEFAGYDSLEDSCREAHRGKEPASQTRRSIPGSGSALLAKLSLPATAMKASHHAAVETSGHATVEAV